VLDVCVDEPVGRGDVLLGVFPFAGEGATEEGLDQPAVDADTTVLAVSFAVTRRECDEVGCTDGLALNMVRPFISIVLVGYITY